jgi:hypothetical protein
MQPATLQADATMPRPVKKIVTDKLAKLRENFWIASRMKTMTSVIDLQTGKLETSGIAAHIAALFENRDISLALLGKLPRRSDACRSGT